MRHKLANGHDKKASEMTKLEHMAATIAAGILAHSDNEYLPPRDFPDRVAYDAVKIADYILEEINKQTKDSL